MSEDEPEEDLLGNAPQPTMTKSGRQVTKPTTYDPAAMDAGTKKRVHYGKRTQEQALCKRCTRMHSPASNQIVFCDRCDSAWHQMCHEPWIADDVVRDAKAPWKCAECQSRLDRHQSKKPKPSEKNLQESWAGKPTEQKKAYLSTLSQQELVELLMRGLESHPDLPIFPATDSDASGQGLPLQNGSVNSVRKTSQSGRSSPAKGRGNGKNRRSLTQKEDGQEQEEFDPYEPRWSEAGKGLYSQLPPESADTEHLVDGNDFEAFSVIIYNEKGRKVEENGKKV